MAKVDDKIFGAMNYVDAGAIMYSEYEQNMNPGDQGRYEDTLVSTFQQAYLRDPHKGKLDFKHWLKTLNTDLVEERALKWEDLRSARNGVEKIREMDRVEAAILEDSGIIQRLAHLHTGRVIDLIPILEVMVPEDAVSGLAMPQESLTPPMQQRPPEGLGQPVGGAGQPIPMGSTMPEEPTQY